MRSAQTEALGAWTALYTSPPPIGVEPRGEIAFPAREVPRHEVRLVAIDRRPARAVPGARLHRFADLPQLLRAGDLVVVNDAATLPASFRGVTARGDDFELRLSAPPGEAFERPEDRASERLAPGSLSGGRRFAPRDGARLAGVLFGAGDWRTRTEHRPAPPRVVVGEKVVLGGELEATVAAIAGRRVTLDADEDGDALWRRLYALGSPVQYAHRTEALPLWSVQTAYASRPWAVEMPSAGRALTWDVLLGLRRAGIEVATLTHAAGLGSTGDAALDRAMPWPERYEIPVRTAAAIRAARAARGRVIAVGTTVVRALEASLGAPGRGTATLRLDAAHPLRVVDGLVSGLHVPGESHFELLEAFAPRAHLQHALVIAAAHGLSAHELGDACLIL